MLSDFGLSVGRPGDLLARERDAANLRASVPASGVARGLALRSLVVSGGWDRLWNFLGRRQSIYFLSVAFDLSGAKPVVLPPKEVPAGSTFNVQHGERIEFSLGAGAPVFPPRPVKGGIVVYITICEADRGTRHVGDVLGKVHKDLAKDDTLTKTFAKLAASPAQAAVEEVLGAATAALQPIATILKNSEDEYVALFSGIFPAKGPWKNRLGASQNGAAIELTELR